jgi:hypothetical protein
MVEASTFETSMGADAGAAAFVSERRNLWLRARRWWLRITGLARRPARRLRLCESLPLGDRRFLALVECGQARFLVGGTSASLVLLARLQPEREAEKEPKVSETERERTEHLSTMCDRKVCDGEVCDREMCDGETRDGEQL